MWNAKLEALTLAAQAFKQEILLPPEGIVMGRSVLGKGFLKLPVEWGQVQEHTSQPSRRLCKLSRLITLLFIAGFQQALQVLR